MPKPTTMDGWWRKLLDTKANGSVRLLATLIGVPTRTLHRWHTGDIKRPQFEQRKAIRAVAGGLVLLPDAPKYLKTKKVTPSAKDTSNSK